jgi:small-conductance mechanosensitive channel
MDLAAIFNFEEGRQLLSALFNKFTIAALILLIGFLVARILGKFAQLIIKEVNVDTAIYSAFGLKVSIGETVSNLITWIAYFVCIVLALHQFSLDVILMNIVAVIVIIIILFSIILAIRDFIPNFTAGLYLRSRRKLKVGQRIRILGMEGKICSFNFMELQLETKKGDKLFLPNSTVLKEQIVRVESKE